MMFGRRTGRTVDQMRQAARGAYYVVPSAGSLDEARETARQWGRTDLRIVSVSAFDNGRVEVFRGMTGHLVIDHATWDAATVRQIDNLQLAMEWLEADHG